MKIFMLLVMFIVLSSCVFAGPMRDLGINVVDPLGNPVVDANVSMYATYNDYFNYKGVTDSNGYLLLEVDARIWEMVQQNYENLTEGVGPNNAERVPIKETTTRVTGNAAKNPSFLFPVMIFNYDLSALGVYDFISMTFVRNFSLRHNVELQFVVSDGTPLIDLPDGLETNEDNDHEIIVNLEDYITDYDNNFDELDITITDEVWSAVDASIEVVGNELIVDFLPALNMDYHQDNTVTFTIKADDGVHSNEREYTYSYVPVYKALLGNVADLYSHEPITNFNIISPNAINIKQEDEQFMAFYSNSENAKINISIDNYYESLRYIDFDNDFEYKFTIIPYQYEAGFGGDPYEYGFNETVRFRTGGQAMVRWETTPIFCIDTSGNFGYTPLIADIQKVYNSLEYADEFTLNLSNPMQNNDELIVDPICYDHAGNHDLGYDVIMWNPAIPAAGLNGVSYDQTNGLIIIRGGVYLKDQYTGQSTYSQEIFQTFGVRQDLRDPSYGQYFPETIFCENGGGCGTSSVPTNNDLAWGVRIYSRELGNLPFDEDPSYFGKENNDNVYTEVRLNYETFINNKKVRITKLEGYALEGMIYDKNEIVDEVPKGAILIKYPTNALELKTKNNINKEKIKALNLNKIKKLISHPHSYFQSK